MWGNITDDDRQALKKFLDKYNINYISNTMEINDYVIGNQSKDSFCYIVERKLSFLGGIKGATASKFGVYYGKKGKDKEKKYRPTQRFGKTYEEAYEKVKSELASLIKKTKEMKAFSDVESLFTGMFKYKIMYIYNPQLLIPIYSKDDLIHFLDNLSIEKAKTYEEMQLILMKYRDDNYPNLDNINFAFWLYERFGRPMKKKERDVNDDKDRLLNKEINEIRRTKKKIMFENKPIEKEEAIVDEKTKTAYYPRKAIFSQIALQNADYKCEYDSSHYCFVRKKDKTRYTEVHHLIPLCYYDEFDVSLDNPANIVSLCSNCHNEIHYGLNAKELIIKLYREREEALKTAGIGISLDKLLKKYNL